MFEFLSTIFTKITSLVASLIIAVGLVSAPASQPELPPQVGAAVEMKQKAQEFENIKLEAELEQAKVEAAKAKAETEQAQREVEAASRKLAEENLRKQQEEQARQLEQQRIQQELAQQNTLSCNGKNWLPCSTGQFYCPATGDARCRIENNASSPVAENPLIKIERCKIEAQKNINNFLEAGKSAISEGSQKCVQDRLSIIQQQMGGGAISYDVISSMYSLARSSCQRIAADVFDKLQAQSEEIYNQQYLECLNQ